MKAAENQKQPIAVTHFQHEFTVTNEMDPELQHFLISRTEGEALEIVRGAEREPGLKQYGGPWLLCVTSTRLSKLGPPVRPLKEKELGPFGELSTSNPGAEVPGVVAPGVAPNVSARGADDVDMGDEVAQRGVSDAESVGGVTNFVNLDDGTARQIQRPRKLRTMC